MGALLGFFPTKPKRAAGDHQIVEQAHARKDAGKLKCPDNAATCESLRLMTGNILVVERNAPCVRSKKSAQNVDQSGLAGSIRPNQSDQFARLDRDADAFESLQPAETFGNVFDAENRHNHFSAGAAAGRRKARSTP